MVDKATMDTIVRDKRASKAASSSIYPIAPHALDPYDDIPDMVKMFWKPDCGGKCRREFQCFASPQRTVFNSALQSLLGEWLRIVDHLNMTAMLHCGSLIASLYRNGTRMRWDHDFDANIWAHDTVLLKRYANTYNAMQGNFDLSIQPNWKKKYDISRKDLGGRELYRFRGHRGFASGNARLYHRKTGKFMDVYPMYADNHGGEEGKDYVVDNNYTNITIYQTNCSYATVPKEWIFPLETCYLEGHQALCPAQPAPLLAAAYPDTPNLEKPNMLLDWKTACWEKASDGVNCGGHWAKTCPDCAMGFDGTFTLEAWCGGDCVWNSTSRVCFKT